MADKEPSILDIDWQHESTEPQSEHRKFHPYGGSVPEVQHTRNVLDTDWHPDYRSDIYSQDENPMADVNPDSALSDTAPQDSEIISQDQMRRRAEKDLEVAQLKQQVMQIRDQVSSINRAMQAAKSTL